MLYTGVPGAKYPAKFCIASLFVNTSVDNVDGNMITDCAKIIGITPAVFTRNGMCVLCPPYIFRPTIRFAY